jgi:mono/diheme cytochrome c family protein
MLVRFLVVCAVALAVGSAAPAAADPGQLYLGACAPCHGPDGRGLAAADPRLLTFESLPPDLTDPEFSSAEPKRDWTQVVRHGGQVMGLSPQMPAFGEGLSEPQIAELVHYAKGFARPASDRWPSGEMNLVRPHLTRKAFPEDELLLLSKLSPGEGGAPDEVTMISYFATRLGARSQVEVKLEQAFAGGETELEAAELGFKHVLAQSVRWRWLLSGGVEVEMPFALDDERPLALGYLALAKPLGRWLDWSVSATYEDGVPLGDGADRPATLDAASAVFLRVPSFKRGLYPGVEVRSRTPLAGGDTAVTVAPALLAKLSRRGHVAVAAGVEVPVVGDPFPYRGHAFLIWEWGEGPPWEGW